MSIVPWKSAEPPAGPDRPMGSLIDELLAPLDRDEFRREITYYRDLTTQSSEPPVPACRRPSPHVSPTVASRSLTAMNTVDLIVNFFKQGGVFLYPIAAVFAIGLVVAVERFIYLTRVVARQSPTVVAARAAAPAGQLPPGDGRRREDRLGVVDDHALRHLARRRRRSAARTSRRRWRRASIEVIPRLEKRTHYLATLANIGMLMGLLGTVIGLIHAFAAVASVNPAEKASMLSASISVAMNNTALGLGLAITLLLCHMYLESKTTELVDSLEVASIKFLNTVDGTPHRAQPAAAPAAYAAQPVVTAGRAARGDARMNAAPRSCGASCATTRATAAATT